MHAMLIANIRNGTGNSESCKRKSSDVNGGGDAPLQKILRATQYQNLDKRIQGAQKRGAEAETDHF